jgi:tetratricopeptide (TPR) repeat protein
MTGMRGVGKTQLAASYARAKLEARWRVVAWVNGEDASSLARGLAAMAEGIGLKSRDGVDPGREVRHWLEADGERCLVVFDDVTDPDELRPYLPAGGRSQVLITSSRLSLEELGQSVGVEVFTTAEATALLAERTRLDDQAGATELSLELGFLPLALSQAAAVIRVQHLSYSTYLQRLRTLPVADYLTPSPGQPYSRGVAETVLLSLEAIPDEDAPEACLLVMALLCVLSPAGVSRELLQLAGQTGAFGNHAANDQAAAVDQLLGRLAERSLLVFSLDGRAVIAHRLVLRVVRERLTRLGRLAQVCQAATSALEAYAGDLVGSADRASVRDATEQVAALARIASEFAGDKEGMGERLLGLRLLALYHLNELDDSPYQAIVVGEALVEDGERLLGPGHPNPIVSRSNLANAYRAVGRIDDATRLQERTLRDMERLYGPDDSHTLGARTNLALSYQEAGRAGEAITLLRRTLADRERILGPDHPAVLRDRNNLAAAHQRAGRPAEAIPLHERTLADRERILGPDHPHTLMSRGNLAVAYQQAGRNAEAIPLHERTLADRERILGPDHPVVLDSRGNLAVAYKEAGRNAEAIPLLERTLADRERILGPEHPDVLASRTNLGNAYQETGRTPEAIALHERTLADHERILGPDHPDTLGSLGNLANAYQSTGRFDEAITLHTRALANMRRVLGPGHPQTLKEQQNLAVARLAKAQARE